jgi:hypothetical protein
VKRPGFSVDPRGLLLSGEGRVEGLLELGDGPVWAVVEYRRANDLSFAKPVGGLHQRVVFPWIGLIVPEGPERGTHHTC